MKKSHHNADIAQFSEVVEPFNIYAVTRNIHPFSESCINSSTVITQQDLCDNQTEQLFIFHSLILGLEWGYYALTDQLQVT